MKMAFESARRTTVLKPELPWAAESPINSRKSSVFTSSKIKIIFFSTSRAFYDYSGEPYFVHPYCKGSPYFLRFSVSEITK